MFSLKKNVFEKILNQSILLFLALSFTMVTGYADQLQDGSNAYLRKDYEKAHRLIFPLASKGNAVAQFFLGTMYDQGKGVPHNPMIAFKWYSLSAELGYSRAQFNLAEMYREGFITAQDFKKALKWYRLAAEQGLAEAQCNLGSMYENCLLYTSDAADE